MPKSSQTREGKSDGKYTKPNSYIFALLWKDVRMDEALCIYHHSYPSLFVYFLACYSNSFYMGPFIYSHLFKWETLYVN